jgi:hypothetical protein
LSAHTQLLLARENEFLKQALRRPRGAPIRVVFVSHLYTLWNCFASVIAELGRRPAFEVAALAVPFTHRSLAPLSEHIRHPVEDLLRQGVPFVDPARYNIHRQKPDVAFFQAPYNNVREARYLPELLFLHHTRSALIPYCTETIGDEPFYARYMNDCRGFWRVFAPSAMSARLYRERLSTPDWFAPVTGNPEYDIIAGKLPEDLPKARRIKEMAAGRRIVLWTPHFALGGWSTWGTLGPGLVEMLAARREELFVVLRPHQHLSAEIAAWKPGRPVDDLFSRLACRMHEAGNFWLDADGQAIEPVLACDALVSDISSLVAKAMALEKSVLLTLNRGADDIGFSEAVLGKHVHKAYGLDQAECFIDLALHGRDPLLPVPAHVRRTFCGPVDGLAAVRIADYLEACFNPEDASA